MKIELLQIMKERLTEQKSIGSVDVDIINQAIKELKALEIIKKYIRVDKPFGSACYIYLNDESEMIPEEEYDLLKKVLL